MDENILIIDRHKKPTELFRQKEREIPLPEHMNYVKLPFEKAEILLKKTFEQLKPDDFLRDSIVEGFYRQYVNMTKVRTRRKERYSAYQILLKQKEKNEDESKLFTKLDMEFCDANINMTDFNIPGILFFFLNMVCKNNLSEINQKIIDVVSHIYKDGQKKTDKTTIIQALKFFLQESIVSNSEGVLDEDETNDEGEAVHGEINNILRKEVKEIYGEDAIRVKKNEKLSRLLQVQHLFNETEKLFVPIEDNPVVNNMVVTCHIINAPAEGFSGTNPTIIGGSNCTIYKKDGSPMKPGTQKSYNGQIIVTPNNSLLEAYNRGRGTVLVSPGSQMVQGGGIEQGVETNESLLCICSSIMMAYNCLNKEYPMSDNKILYLPDVLIMRDFTVSNYPTLENSMMKFISVINSPPKYRPSTTLGDLDNYSMDGRLQLPTTRLTNEARAYRQIRNIFALAHYLGFKKIVLDDFGVEDFWIPVHHMAEILSNVAREYKDHFIEIVFAISKMHLYSIYSRYFEGL